MPGTDFNRLLWLICQYLIGACGRFMTLVPANGKKALLLELQLFADLLARDIVRTERHARPELITIG